MEYTKQEMIDFLEGNLIPDLIESGTHATASSFQACVLFMKGAKTVLVDLEDTGAARKLT